MMTEKYTQIERACEGTAWEATLLRERLEIRLTADTRRQQFENQGPNVYAPEIRYGADGFQIQTCSHGVLNASEIERFAAVYLSATQLVHTLSRILDA